MSPTTSHIALQLRQLVYYHLDCNLLSNALFFAGRYLAYEPRSSEAAFLLALCQVQLGQYRSAYDTARPAGIRGTHLGCSYVFAQACLELSKFSDGLNALERSKGLWAGKSNWNKHSEAKRQHLPDAPAVLCLLGKLCHAYNDVNKAAEYYTEAVRLNPFMWDAILALCDLGMNIRMPNIFKMTPEMMKAISAGGASEDISPGILEDSCTTHPAQPPAAMASIPVGNDPFSVSTNRINGDIRMNAGKSALFEKLNGVATLTPSFSINESWDSAETPTGAGIAVAAQAKPREANVAMLDAPSIVEPPHAPLRKSRIGGGLGVDLASEAPPKMKSTVRMKTRAAADADEVDTRPGTGSLLDRKRTVSGKVPEASTSTAPLGTDPMAPKRRSARLETRLPTNRFAMASGIPSTNGRDIKKVKASGARGRTTQNGMGRVLSTSRKHLEASDIDGKDSRPQSSASIGLLNTRSLSSEKAKEEEALNTLLDLLAKLGTGYFALSHYRCEESLQVFSNLPVQQRDTPWVLAQIGRAHYEQASYAKAEEYFKRLRMTAPSRLEDMELYSTCLWHQKNDIDLAFLAHELMAVDRLSPQAWCAVGNLYSRQKDHDQALRCFKRATHLDPSFAYAFTLQGHEHVASEEYDKALAAYRRAIGADPRHYNAWYGLARVFEKQGKYEAAEKHFLVAADINPTNAVLLCCVGMVLEKLHRPELALARYSRSCELAPTSTLARFKRARVLLSLQRPDQALGELRILKDIAPDEANVHFLLGRTYKTLKRKGEAIKHFTTALNLDPKASHHIKEAMEQMEDDMDEDGMM